MLYDLKDNQLTHIPHSEEYEQWRARLSDTDYDAIIAELHRIMDENQIFNASYIPGSDWQGTVYQPIYHACDENWDEARLFYGLLVWGAVQLHADDWRFYREERPGRDPIGLTYFRRTTSPP